MKSFTLIELIVVIAIIAILAAIIAPNAFKAIEKAKISRAIALMKTVKTAFLAYRADTGQWPPDYNGYDPLGTFNALLDDSGVSGWDGPYLENYGTHPWGGGIGYFCLQDNAGWENQSGCWLYLDDDKPGTGYANNQAKIPYDSLLRIDELIDDNNTSNGSVRENLPGVPGELSYFMIETD
ncbi:MAG: type II secretion system protein GspG [Candidatus Omnitrophica bacterium]|nr:type II secretion system protein GspG [Candidatus Omnitrophota bacterium]MBU2043736.1 type II secretion system protein GspG [Candidatus Omnitrophota bacterium]MBU2474046.1 type II secretion system protein GspG [Candidatus Omnitrophota bacterium]